MGYQEREPVALCDGCGKRLYNENQFYCFDWIEDNTIYIHGLIAPEKLRMLEFGSHYCCITPCLERALIVELRSAHESQKKKAQGQEVGEEATGSCL